MTPRVLEAFPRHHGCMTDDRDYPQMAAARGRIEPAPRRVRGFLGHELVFDTTAARYVWEVPYYPQYYIPLADVRTEFLRDENHPQKVQFGHLPAALSGGRRPDAREGCPGVRRTDPSRAWCASSGIGCAGSRRTNRSTVIRATPMRESTRCARTATSACSSTASCSPTPSHRCCCSKPVCRQGITSIPSDVAFEHLEPSSTETLCPYKGTTSGYWSVRVGDTVHPDLAWTYHYPLPAVAPIAGMVAFYNEKLDIIVDGVELARPKTQFS